MAQPEIGVACDSISFLIPILTCVPRFVVSKLGFPLVRYPLTFDDEDLEGIEGWIQCVK